MADAIVSVILNQLTSETFKKLREEVRLVRGVSEEVNQLTRNYEDIREVLVDAERKQLNPEETGVRGWLDDLKDISYDMDDVLDEWNTASLKLRIEKDDQKDVVPKKKVCFFFPSPLFHFKQVSLRHDIAVKIKDINGKLDSIAKRRERFRLDKNSRVQESSEPSRVQEFSEATSSFDEFEIYGRDDQKSDLLNQLLSERKKEGKGIPIISIVGMGGIGKTTLAQFAYNDSKTKRNFQKRIWVYVSKSFDKIRVAKEIIEGFEGQVPNLVNFDSLLNCISKTVEGKKFILVLDDVWTEDDKKWKALYNSLNNGHPESKILVTTRNQMVAHKMSSMCFIDVEELSCDASWSLFKQYSGRSQLEGEELGKIGREIVEKCKGLPLAIKTVGSLLRWKKTREQWKEILDSEMWKLEGLEEYVFRPLLLSYDDLPPKLKQCFSYCAIFPKGYNIDKDKLVKLWMAQGYLGLDQREDLELKGEYCFDKLAMLSFFQEFVKDEDDNIIRCKMHDIMHDLALFLVKKDCFAMKIDCHEVLGLNPSYEKVRHLMLIMKEGTAFSLNRFGIQKLRSLLIESWDINDILLMQSTLPRPNLFEQLTCVRSLEISNEIMAWDNMPIQNIPKEIGKLIHLRHLNLSRLKIDEMPHTLCDLFNLQTLYVIQCFCLKNLPQGMGKLVNLRHLILEDNLRLQYLPKGIERLTNLRTLSTVIVNGDREVCGLDCLKNFNHLRGQLEIQGLGNVLDEDEAKNARLKDKENILGLTLQFRSSSEEASSNMDEAVLEALEPPPLLEKLEITGYDGGIAFPNWMVSLTCLKKILLAITFNCEYLPALGQLPSLETVGIYNMVKLKRVGNEFLGVENSSSSSSSSSSSAPLIAFPKLKGLHIFGIQEWKEWEYENRKDIIIMPSLSQLIIFGCPKLKALPDHFLHSISLQKLCIQGCTLLENWCQTKGILFTGL